jgi:hypothetical protein
MVGGVELPVTFAELPTATAMTGRRGLSTPREAEPKPAGEGCCSADLIAGDEGADQ